MKAKGIYAAGLAAAFVAGYLWARTAAPVAVARPLQAARAAAPELPPGHPAIGAPAPALKDAALAAGKASDCPYLSKTKEAKKGADAAQSPDAALEQYITSVGDRRQK